MGGVKLRRFLWPRVEETAPPAGCGIMENKHTFGALEPERWEWGIGKGGFCQGTANSVKI